MTRQRLCIGLLIMPFLVSAQLAVSPIQKQHLSGAQRNKELQPMPLPFWDDFSSASNSDTLSADQATVWINDGMGIKPPTIMVALFDGLDASGIPYAPNVNQNLDYGFTDSLVSRKIRMADVPLFLRNTVFMSFFYQWGGNGEAPDAIDFLRLEFLNDSGQWETILTLQAQETQLPDRFYSAVVRINQPQFFHNDFQFRFRSFGRRSGRYDTWNIDYIYLNRNRTENDLIQGFPDRANYLPLTTLFTPYYAMPIRHYFDDADGNTGFPSFGVSNLSSIPQPMNYDIDAEVHVYRNGVKESLTFNTDSQQPILPTMGPFEQRTIAFKVKPDLSTFADADSLQLNVKTTLVTGDSVNTGFEPIDFHINDTLRKTYVLKDYYAYDDGTAEYAVGLTQSGNRAAYRFLLSNLQRDTLNGIYIHYPFTQGTASTSVRVQVWDNLNGLPDQLILEESIPVQRSANSRFLEINFSQAILVQDTIYIGWQQPASGRVQIGLDTSNDTGEQIFINTTGTWIPNAQVRGSLLLRPRFGKGDVITSVEKSIPSLSIYPNPNRGIFTISGTVSPLSIISVSGKPVSFETLHIDNQTHIQLTDSVSGLLLIRYSFQGQVITAKILVHEH